MNKFFPLLLILFVVISGSFLSCKEKEGECVSFIEIGRGYLDGAISYPCERFEILTELTDEDIAKLTIPKQERVINTQDEWDDLCAILECRPPWVTRDYTEIEIDFNKYQVIAVFDEVRQNTWNMKIDCIYDCSDKLIVVIQIIRPKSYGSTNFGYWQRFHIVKIPITQKTIEFKQIIK
jgi:hypothetical protein